MPPHSRTGHRMKEASEGCRRCDRSAIGADDLDNWIANGERDLICPSCQTQQERIAGARSSLEGLAHLTRLRERRSQCCHAAVASQLALPPRQGVKQRPSHDPGTTPTPSVECVREGLRQGVWAHSVDPQGVRAEQVKMIKRLLVVVKKWWDLRKAPKRYGRRSRPRGTQFPRFPDH